MAPVATIVFMIMQGHDQRHILTGTKTAPIAVGIERRQRSTKPSFVYPATVHSPTHRFQLLRLPDLVSS